MTTEEKAKAYDEAIKRARNHHDNDGLTLEQYETIDIIFPELKESEDERIRKALIKSFEIHDLRALIIPGFSAKDVIAWLEKQGESTDINPSEFDLRLNKLLKQFETLPKEELASSLSFYLNVVQNDGTYKADEKQGEQKVPVIDFKAKDWYVSKVDGKIRNIYHSVDKVEPKFKVGDWIVRELDNTCYQIKKCILNVTTNKYGYDLTNGGYISSQDANFYHLWTIQDAKDGDVLCCESGWTCIFKKLNHNSFGGLLFDSYCFIDRTGWFCDGAEGHTLDERINGRIYPATKEQRELLFKSMKDDGYEWDAEKLELKEIEQKPVWNKNDENYMKSAIEMIMHCIWNSYRGLYKEDVVEWLKSLKYRFAENNEELN